MELNGNERITLRMALLAAFPEEDKLRLMLRERCDKQLALITTANNLATIVSDVIEDADSQGWVESLLTGAREANPTNQKLQQCARNYAENIWREAQELYDRASGEPTPNNWDNAVKLLERVVKLQDNRLPEDAEWWRGREALDGRSATDLLKEADQQHRLAEEYETARAAETRGDWARAIELLRRITAAKPDYRDVRQRLLHAERQSRLVQWDNEARAAEARDDWEHAIELLEHITAEEPNYHDAPQRLARAERQSRLVQWDNEARAVEARGDWEHALRLLHRIAAEEPTYRDVPQRLARAERRLRLVRWDEEARAAEARGDWARAAKLLGMINREEPDDPGVRERLPRARRELRERRKWQLIDAARVAVTLIVTLFAMGLARTEPVPVASPTASAALPAQAPALQAATTAVSFATPASAAAASPAIMIRGFHVTQGGETVFVPPNVEIDREDGSIEFEVILSGPPEGLTFAWVTSKGERSQPVSIVGNPTYKYVVPEGSGSNNQVDVVTVEVLNDGKLVAKATITVAL
ncbi:MAG TPA: effector-associated domain EAD1-containing protein [Chloroflexaceae bacterium]|nr:effector-associated domain EAD1-containing protein [Chloroflexaceae bacterium]